MAHYMTDSNIPVKHDLLKYSCGVLDRPGRMREYKEMENLRRIRKNKHLSQTQLAEASGCSQGLISKLETGGKNVTLSQIEDIAAALNCEAWELFGISELNQRYLEALNQASPEKRAAVLLLLKSDD